MPLSPPCFRLLGLALVALPGAAAIARADAPPKMNTAAPSAQADPSAAAPRDPFEQAIAARHVADFARRRHDGYAMLVAAKMLAEIPVSPAPAEPGLANPPEAEAADGTFSPAALFAQARALAGNDQVLLTQIRVTEERSARGVLDSAFGKGLVRSVQLVNPRTAYQFSVTAKGGEKLRIGAIGDIGTTLLMRLVDSNGKVVCLDDQNDYAPVCQLTPGAASRYKVDLMNKGAAKSRTVILSN